MEMNWKRLFSCTPLPASAFSSATPFWLLASSSKDASPVAAAFRTTTPTVPLVGPTAICSSSGLSTCTPLVPPDKLRKGSEASGPSTPLIRTVSSIRIPLVPPCTVSQGAAGSLRTRGACSSLSICCVAVTELLLAKAPVARWLPCCPRRIGPHPPWWR